MIAFSMKVSFIQERNSLLFDYDNNIENCLYRWKESVTIVIMIIWISMKIKVRHQEYKRRK